VNRDTYRGSVRKYAFIRRSNFPPLSRCQWLLRQARRGCGERWFRPWCPLEAGNRRMVSQPPIVTARCSLYKSLGRLSRLWLPRQSWYRQPSIHSRCVAERRWYRASTSSGSRPTPASSSSALPDARHGGGGSGNGYLYHCLEPQACHGDAGGRDPTTEASHLNPKTNNAPNGALFVWTGISRLLHRLHWAAF